MSVLPVAAFEDMRGRVFAGRAASMATPDGVAVDGPEAGTTLVALGPRDLAIVALAQNRAALVLAGLVGVVNETGWLETGLRRVFGPNAAVGLLHWAQRQDALACLGLAVALVIAWVVVSALLSMVWTFARFHEFRLVLAGSDLRADYGLFTRVSATLPRQRIQSATVRQGLVHRLARCVAVRARSAGGVAEGSPGTSLDWIAPVLPGAQTTSFLNAVMPEAIVPPDAWAHVHERAWLRLFRARLVWAGVAAVVLAFRLHWWALPAFVTAGVAAAVLARMQTARMAWALTDRAIAFRSGLVRHQMDVVPLAKIQVVSVRQSPFDRRGGMATVSVDTAGTSVFGPSVRIPFLPADTARVLVSRLGIAANDLTFRW
jgi:putative membrane protein